MGSRALGYLLLAIVAIASVECNLEGDALHAWKAKLADPNNVLQSWDPTLVNPCTWLHVTCNNESSVSRVDLGSAGLSGPLVPELGILSNLKYLVVSNNSINGSIPMALGNLTNLISLDLQHNKLSGMIPSALANLRFLTLLKLNHNNFTGILPGDILYMIIRWGNLVTLDVSYNQLEGTAPPTNGTGPAVTTIILDPKAAGV